MGNKSHSGKQTVKHVKGGPNRRGPLSLSTALAFEADGLTGGVDFTTYDRNGREIGTFKLSQRAALDLYYQLGDAIAVVTGQRGHVGSDIRQATKSVAE